jgi:RimJ/RimL family protein N-acetyltransferase
VRAENPASGRVLEKAGFLRTGTRLYQDLHDSREELYHFYRLTRDLLLEKGGMPWDL